MAKWSAGFSPRHFLASLVVAAIAALALSYIRGLTVWGGFAIVIVALLVNGWLATWEDNQPGGFNNPIDRNETNSRQRQVQRVQSVVSVVNCCQVST